MGTIDSTPVQTSAKPKSARRKYAPIADTSMMGAPPTYEECYGAEICRRIADGETTRSILRSLNIPPGTAYGWLDNDNNRVGNDTFAIAFARAQQLRLRFWRDEIIAIGQDASGDVVTINILGADGRMRQEVRVSHAAVNRSKLQCDNLRWMLERLDRELMPRAAQELSGPAGSPLQLQATPQLARLAPDQWLALAQAQQQAMLAAQQASAPALPAPTEPTDAQVVDIIADKPKDQNAR